MQYVSYKDRKALVMDLKRIYEFITEDDALEGLESFDSKWGVKHPQIPKSWDNNWANIVIFLNYPASIRKVIYTTNCIESLK